MRACQHDIFENISENIFEDIFKETLRPRTRIVGRPTTSWHLASCDATSLPYCRSLPLAPSLPSFTRSGSRNRFPQKPPQLGLVELGGADGRHCLIFSGSRANLLWFLAVFRR
jgi:hypothetical protein